MKTHFSPANSTIAVMATRGSDTLVEKFIAPQECILVAMLVSLVRGIFTDYRETHVSLRAGQALYFVASERKGYSYLVFEVDGAHHCTCKDARNGLPCQHTDDVASYEARCQAEVKASMAGLIERTVLDNGTVLYIFQSSSDPEYQYWITSTYDGRIDTSTHEDCKGFHFHRHCCHMDVVIAGELPAYEARIAREKAHSDAFYRAYTSSAYYLRTFGKLA